MASKVVGQPAHAVDHSSIFVSVMRRSERPKIAGAVGIADALRAPYKSKVPLPKGQKATIDYIGAYVRTRKRILKVHSKVEEIKELAGVPYWVIGMGVGIVHNTLRK